MNRETLVGWVAGVACVTILAGCASTPAEKGVLVSPESQLKLRSMQSRAFDIADRQKVLRNVVATLQDLEFMIEAADAGLGTVTARKFMLPRGGAIGSDLTLTVTVRPRGEMQTVVRANAEFNRNPVEDPKVYQNFFTTLGKSLFLTGHAVD